MPVLTAALADSPPAVLSYSGMFEDDTFVYMIEPLELTDDEVGLGHQFPYGIWFSQHQRPFIRVL